MGFFPFSFAKNFDEDDLISMQGWFWKKELAKVAIGETRSSCCFLWLLGQFAFQETSLFSFLPSDHWQG
jgi:hypothetical protein